MNIDLAYTKIYYFMYLQVKLNLYKLNDIIAGYYIKIIELVQKITKNKGEAFCVVYCVYKKVLN